MKKLKPLTSCAPVHSCSSRPTGWREVNVASLPDSQLLILPHLESRVRGTLEPWRRRRSICLWVLLFTSWVFFFVCVVGVLPGGHLCSGKVLYTCHLQGPGGESEDMQRQMADQLTRLNQCQGRVHQRGWLIRRGMLGGREMALSSLSFMLRTVSH